MTQPEALRLADALETAEISYTSMVKAAAELRRLYDLAMELQGKIYALEMARSMEQKTAKLKRDALLKSLKEAVDVCGWPNVAFFHKALAAIKAAEQESA